MAFAPRMESRWKEAWHGAAMFWCSMVLLNGHLVVRKLFLKDVGLLCFAVKKNRSFESFADLICCLVLSSS